MRPRLDLFLILLLIGGNIQAFSQNATTFNPKGKAYAFWGWNRDVYTKSNLHFWGDNYNFTLRDVVAQDKPEPLSLRGYLGLAQLTIPQTDARLGYFFKKDYSVSIGIDHMKYVMVQSQVVEVNGSISGTGTVYDRDYHHQFLYTRREFLTFEHTDGLNYFNTELRRHTPILSWHKNKWLSLDLETFSGLGVGLLIPKTNTKLLSMERHDAYHLSGWGTHILTGLGLTLWNHLVINSEFKAGYINMPDIRTTSSKSDHASQRFLFGEFALIIGGSFRLWK